MKFEKGYLSTVPRKSLFVFLLGVFLIFATVGLAADMANFGREPILTFLVMVLTISTFAVGYAIAGFTMRGQSWKAVVPIFVLQFLVINVLHRLLPSMQQLQQIDANTMAQVKNRLSIDALVLIATMGLGYACFVYASITEGRRYFRAHAEIGLAREIHEVLVPTISAQVAGWEFYGRSTPSSEVGGDLIDVAGNGDKWVAYLADVSGHGVAPGVVVGMTKSASRMLLSSGDASEHLMPRLNEVLFPLKKPDMFVTFCFVASNGDHLCVGLAGHPAILQFSARTNQVTEIECPNLPLGILPSGDFATSEIVAECGTLFALYTDGLLETANAAGEEFGVQRLKAELQKHAKEPLEEIWQSIQHSVARHGSQFDDQSMLLIRKIEA
jgi:serine phosphatase RsbU (regulator of sigma subunit)